MIFLSQVLNLITSATSFLPYKVTFMDYWDSMIAWCRLSCLVKMRENLLTNGEESSDWLKLTSTTYSLFLYSSILTSSWYVIGTQNDKDCWLSPNMHFTLCLMSTECPGLVEHKVLAIRCFQVLADGSRRDVYNFQIIPRVKQWALLPFHLPLLLAVIKM